jgi:hypothetical protein
MELEQLIYTLGLAAGGLCDLSRRRALTTLIRQGRLEAQYIELLIGHLAEVLRKSEEGEEGDS